MTLAIILLSIALLAWPVVLWAACRSDTPAAKRAARNRAAVREMGGDYTEIPMGHGLTDRGGRP